VSGINITRAEAADRSAGVSVIDYRVHVDLSDMASPDATTFLSTTTVRFGSTPGLSTWIDLVAAGVDRAVLNDRELDVDTVFDGHRLALEDLSESNTLTVTARCSYMTTGEGLHRFVDPVDGFVYLYTQFEVADARRVYACFDQPDLKSSFSFSVTAPAGLQVVSNSPTPTPTQDAGLALWDFDPTPRMSTYITALIVGPYHVVRDEHVGAHGTYPLAVLCRESLAQYLDAEDVLTVTKQGFALFESAFDTPYPFVKYDQAFVPEFNAGAMENAGAVTLTDDYVFRSRVTGAAYETRANTVLHELAHMWFGDLVTMSWWDDLWLNESFAEWAAHWSSVEATKYTDAWTTFLNQRKAWGYRQDQLPSTHPVVADMVDLEAVEVNFDGITYAKGASALRQLVAWVGEKEFLAGLRSYFTKYAWGNTALNDLLAELELSSGRDLTEWSRTWLETSGVNLLRPEIVIGPDGHYEQVTIVQDPPSAPVGIAPTLRPHRIALGLYDRDDEGGLVRSLRIEIDVTGERTDVPELTGMAVPDMLLLNDDDLTFAKIRLDPHSMSSAVKYLDERSAALPRALVWGAAWDMTRDAELSTDDFLTLVLSGLGAETDIGVTQQVFAQVKAAIEQYGDPARRPHYRDRLAESMLRRLTTAEPGSDHQLVFARGYSAAARTPEQAAVVASWLDGSAVPTGLSIDTDLRWSLVQRLVSMGQLGPEVIDDELARDDTATGRRHAALAHAAVPTAAAKAAAFEAIIGDGSMHNTILVATIQGFVQADQRDLLRPFVDPYFAALPRIWAERTNETAQTVTMGLYPALLAEDATLTATDRFLAHDDLPLGARRLVSEGRDGVARAMRAQKKDAAQ
jgi:aminopeptidase N